MRFSRMFSFCFFLLVASVLSVHAATFMIEIQVSSSEDEMQGYEKNRIRGIESGLMDVLFYDGNIFFNSYKNSSENDSFSSFNDSLSLAKDSGADYFLELLPDESGAKWNLYRVGKPEKIKTSYEDIMQIEKNSSVEKRWMALGAILGQHMLESISNY